MDPVTMTSVIKKHGISALLCFCIFWLNNRLINAEEKIEKVEDKLYECLQKSAYKNQASQREKKGEKTFQAFTEAIIPKETRYENERKMAV